MPAPAAAPTARKLRAIAAAIAMARPVQRVTRGAREADASDGPGLPGCGAAAEVDHGPFGGGPPPASLPRGALGGIGVMGGAADAAGGPLPSARSKFSVGLCSSRAVSSGAGSDGEGVSSLLIPRASAATLC